MIEAGRHTGALSSDSKLKPERQIVTHLHTVGRLEALRWLERDGHRIGLSETADLYKHFNAPLRSMAWRRRFQQPTNPWTLAPSPRSTSKAAKSDRPGVPIHDGD